MTSVIESKSPGSLPHVSWSQIEAFRLCERRWWFKWHRPEIQDPGSDATDLGTDCHGIVEAHFDAHAPKPKRRFSADHPAYASTGVLLLDPRMPPRDADIRVEFPRDSWLGIDLAGVPVKGRIDLLWAHSPEHVGIYDWKTLGDWRYAKNEDSLERFGQMIVYGKFVFDRIPSVRTVDFTHGQIHTKTVDARVVTTRPLDRDHVYGLVPSVESTVQEMAAAYAITEPKDVPADTSQCRAFGKPCPYTDVCPRSIYAGFTTSTAVPIQGAGSMTLAEKLKARAAAAKSPTTPTTPTPETLEGSSIAGPRATGINPPDASKPDTSKAGSYGAQAGSYTPPPVTGSTSATTTPAVSGAVETTTTEFRLVIEIGGQRFKVPLEALEPA